MDDNSVPGANHGPIRRAVRPGPLPPGHAQTTRHDPQGATCHLTPSWILLIMADNRGSGLVGEFCSEQQRNVSS